MDPFARDHADYRRDYNLHETYLHDTSTYLSRMAQIPLEEARRYVEQLIAPDGQHPLKIPMARFLLRNDQGDRVRRQMPFDQFLQQLRQEEEILAPNLTSYLPPKKKRSLHSDYIAGNLKKRSTAKKEQFKAEREGNRNLMQIRKSAQTTYKIKNNALSGAYVSPYTILYNKTAHSTLTSGCRTATSYGNANNERFLYGNRHYWSPSVTQNNIISIVNHTDYARIERLIETHGLILPTAEDVMAMIERSTKYYWRDAGYMTRIQTLVQSLTPQERAAVLFTGDLYHLAQVNPDLVHTFLRDMSYIVETPDASLQSTIDGGFRPSEEISVLTSMLRSELLFNPTTERFETIADVVRESPRQLLAHQSAHIATVQARYHDLIQAFWVTDNLPASIYYLPNIIRRGVITSDTDSTIFTVAHWPHWYTKSERMSREALAIAAVMVYLSSKVITHILARFSANCGIPPEEVSRLQMKNEFFFPVFTLTSRAKHYFANISMQEGNTKAHLELEVKGVALRNSSVPSTIMQQSHALMRALMAKVMAGESISLRSVLRRVALIENDIKQSILNGDFTWLKRMEVKRRDSYKLPEQSNYLHYELWEAVFARKYGHAPEPPYRVVKVSVDALNKTRFNQWMDSIEDPAIAQNFREWMAQRGKDNIGTLLLPETNLVVSGIPAEIKPRVNLRNLIAQTMESFYLVLECLGFYMQDRHLSRLLSDNEWLISPDNPIEPFQID